jgi:ribosomal protein L33
VEVKLKGKKKTGRTQDKRPVILLCTTCSTDFIGKKMNIINHSSKLMLKKMKRLTSN